MRSTPRFASRQFVVGALVAVSAGLAGYALAADKKGDHPRIQAAIDSIRDAEEYLEKAPNEFKGHKKEAIEACRKARTELRACLEVK